MSRKVIIALGSVVLLCGIGFIVFSSNDQIAEVIHEVETATQELAENNTHATTTDEVSENNMEEVTTTPSQTGSVSQNTSVSEPTNRVMLGEIDNGNIVTVPYAYLLEDGYIVLYRINNRGEASLAGKSGLLESGEHRNVSIQTIAIDRQAIVAILHRDDGNGKFEYPGADEYLLNGSLLASDIDVVGVKREDRESRVLQTQVEAFLETNFMD